MRLVDGVKISQPAEAFRRHDLLESFLQPRSLDDNAPDCTVLTLVETRSVAWAESMRLALLADGIEAVVLDQHSQGTMGTLRVAIVNDSDLPRAAKVVDDLRPPKTGPLPSWWWHKRALVVLGAGFVLVYAATLVAESASIRPLAQLLTMVGAAAFPVGFALLFVGYRADRRRIAEQSEV